MKLQPLEDRIVVRAGEPEETTVSGLVIPDTAKEKPQQGEVLAVGPGRRSEHSGELIPVDVAVGDVVRGRGDLADELSALVLEDVLDLDLACDRDAVVGDRRRAELLVQHDVAALGAERDLDGVGERVDAAKA